MNIVYPRLLPFRHRGGAGLAHDTDELKRHTSAWAEVTVRMRYRVVGRVGNASVPLNHTKDRLEDLAIFGGLPAFAEPLYVGRPNIGSRTDLHGMLDQILDTRRLSNHGPFVVAFEQRVCELTGARHCIAVTNATIGLELLLRGLDLQGEVVVPSFTFAATVHAVTNAGLRPIFADIDPETHCLDPASVAACMSGQTAAILGTHLWGQCCNVPRLQQVADAWQVPLLFDAAHAFGCGAAGEIVGRLGDAEVFSFHATKVVNCFEGGAIVTRNDQLAERLRRTRNFGFAGVDNIAEVGTNAKMHELSAAMGLVSLNALQEIIDSNRAHHATYRAHLEQIPGLRCLAYDRFHPHNYHYVVVEVDAQQTGVHRDLMLRILQAENVLARRYFYPGCHRLPPYQQAYAAGPSALPWTEHVADRVLILPTGPTLQEEDVRLICHIIQLVATHASEVRQLSAA